MWGRRSMPNQELAPEQELKRSAEALNEDGTVDVTVLDWEKSGDYVEVTFTTPTMNRRCERMHWPKPHADFDDYKFVRLLREAGLGVSEPDQLHGHETTAKVVDSETWELDPSPPVPVRERLSVDPSLIVLAHFVLIVLTVLLSIIASVVMVL